MEIMGDRCRFRLGIAMFIGSLVGIMYYPEHTLFLWGPLLLLGIFLPIRPFAGCFWPDPDD